MCREILGTRLQLASDAAVVSLPPVWLLQVPYNTKYKIILLEANTLPHYKSNHEHP